MESDKFLLVESGILGFGIWNTAQGIRDSTSDWTPESKFHWQSRQSSTWNPESTGWNPEKKTDLDFRNWGDKLLKGAVSRNSAKLGNYKMPAKLREA